MIVMIINSQYNCLKTLLPQQKEYISGIRTVVSHLISRMVSAS